MSAQIRRTAFHRNRVRLTLDDSCSLFHRPYSAAYLTDVPCRLSEAKSNAAQEKQEGSRIQSEVLYTVFLPADTERPKPTDRIIVGSRTFHVRGIKGGTRSLTLPVECVEVT